MLVLRSRGTVVCFVALRAPADDRILAEADLAATLLQMCGVYSCKLLTSEQDTEGSLWLVGMTQGVIFLPDYDGHG